MPKVDPLYELIKSLTPAEKRDFKKKHKPQKGDTLSHSFELFEVLDGLKEYNEEKVKQKIKHKKFVLSNGKNHLYKLVIRFLRTYHQEEIALTQLYALLTDIQILTDKNLLDQAWTTIRKAKKKAKEYHHDIILLKLLVLEKTLIRQYAKLKSNKLIDENHEETEKYLEQFSVSLDLFKFYDKIFLLTRNKDLKVNGKKIAQELINNLPTIPPTSFDNKMLYHQAYSLYYKHIDDKNDNLEYSASHLITLIQYFDENPHLIDEYTIRYIYIINNYLNCCIRLKSFTEFPVYIKRLEDIPKKIQRRENIGYKLFEVKSYLNFVYYLSSEKFKEGLQIIPEIQKDFRKFEHKISSLHQISTHHNIGLLYFQNELYTDAQTSLFKITNESRQDMRQDIKLFCQLLLVLIAYEQQTDACDAMARSIQRNPNYNNHYAKEVATTIRKALNEIDPKSLFQELKDTLKKRLNYEHGKDQILIWLKKKI